MAGNVSKILSSLLMWITLSALVILLRPSLISLRPSGGILLDSLFASTSSSIDSRSKDIIWEFILHKVLRLYVVISLRFVGVSRFSMLKSSFFLNWTWRMNYGLFISCVHPRSPAIPWFLDYGLSASKYFRKTPHPGTSHAYTLQICGFRIWVRAFHIIIKDTIYQLQNKVLHNIMRTSTNVSFTLIWRLWSSHYVPRACPCFLYLHIFHLNFDSQIICSAILLEFGGYRWCQHLYSWLRCLLMSMIPFLYVPFFWFHKNGCQYPSTVCLQCFEYVYMRMITFGPTCFPRFYHYSLFYTQFILRSHFLLSYFLSIGFSSIVSCVVEVCINGHRLHAFFLVHAISFASVSAIHLNNSGGTWNLQSLYNFVFRHLTWQLEVFDNGSVVWNLALASWGSMGVATFAIAS